MRRNALQTTIRERFAEGAVGVEVTNLTQAGRYSYSDAEALPHDVRDHGRAYGVSLRARF